MRRAAGLGAVGTGLSALVGGRALGGAHRIAGRPASADSIGPRTRDGGLFNLSALVSGRALGLRLLAFFNDLSLWLRKRLRALPLTRATCFVGRDGRAGLLGVVIVVVAVLATLLTGCAGQEVRQAESAAGSSGDSLPAAGSSASSASSDARLLGVQPGDDVWLTLRADVQSAAVQALGNRKGAVVVIDPHTGELLALAPLPASLSTACLQGGEDPGVESPDASDDAGSSAVELHIPGSTFKTVTLAAALQSGEASVDETFDAPSMLTFQDGEVRNYGSAGYDRPTLMQSYAYSVNTVFAQLSLRVGMERLHDMARAFGFDADLMADLELPRSILQGVDDMSPLEQAWSGVGQATFRQDGSSHGPWMTPVQGAAIAAAIANDGVLMQPYIVSSVNGELSALAAEPQERSRPVSAQTARLISDCMQQVVLEGTGRSAAVDGMDVRGKTGTAETISGSDDGWFIGFVRAGEQSLAFAVLVENDDSKAASSVAGSLVRQLYGGAS